MSMQFGTPCGLAGLGADAPIEYTREDFAGMSPEEARAQLEALTDVDVAGMSAADLAYLNKLAAGGGGGTGTSGNKNAILYAVIGGALLFIMARR